MKAKIILLVLTFTLLLTCDIFSQTIVIDSVSKTGFCYKGDDEFKVYYSVSGSFDDDNFFVVQLSNQDGDFSNFYNIGNVKSIVSGMINCIIPDNAKIGDQYRIRVMSSEPYFVGSEFSNIIEIAQNPIPSFAYDKHVILLNDSIFFSDSSKNAVKWFWNFGYDAIPSSFSGPNPPHVKYSSTGKRQVKLTVESKEGCKKSSVENDYADGGEFIYVFDCFPKIDSTDLVITSDTSIQIESKDTINIWVCSNGHARIIYVRNLDNIFIESGGTVDFDESYLIGGIFMKPGASLNVDYSRDIVILYSDGSSINCDYYDYLNKLKCDDLQFDYTEAPEAGKIAQHLAVDDNLSLNNLNIFPNPSDGIFNISLNSEVPSFTVTIYDVLGSEIYYENVKNITGTWNKKIDLSGSSKGMYFIKFSNIEKNIIQSVILE